MFVNCNIKIIQILNEIIEYISDHFPFVTDKITDSCVVHRSSGRMRHDQQNTSLRLPRLHFCSYL